MGGVGGGSDGRSDRYHGRDGLETAKRRHSHRSAKGRLAAAGRLASFSELATVNAPVGLQWGPVEGSCHWRELAVHGGTLAAHW